MEVNIPELLKENSKLVEKKLDEYLTDLDEDTSVLTQSCRYSVFAGGKRIRPTLVLETCRMFGGNEEIALSFAAAVEMVHTYSLIHDDLPCMDDDDMRRGKQTNHIVFGEATAMLAGDALLTSAFEILTQTQAPAQMIVEAVRCLSNAAGSTGMIGGQVMDMDNEDNKGELTEDKLIKLHAMKTGAMICASVQLGCLAAGILPSDPRCLDLISYADSIGIAFQVVDDMLDVIGDEKDLGKPIGSDEENHKTTFLSFYSLEDAFEYAKVLTNKAVATIEEYENSETLRELAEYLLNRKK